VHVVDRERVHVVKRVHVVDRERVLVVECKRFDVDAPCGWGY
jgi:hypothetical protein